jgi:hypothetical protein
VGQLDGSRLQSYALLQMLVKGVGFPVSRLYSKLKYMLSTRGSIHGVLAVIQLYLHVILGADYQAAQGPARWVHVYRRLIALHECSCGGGDMFMNSPDGLND